MKTTATYRTVPVEVFEVNVDEGTAVIALADNRDKRITVNATALKNVVTQKIS